MGIIQHDYLIATTFSHEYASKAIGVLRDFGCNTASTHLSESNNYVTVMIPTSGSKLDWDGQKVHEALIERFIEWLKGPGEHYFIWTWFSHGEFGARIEATNAKNVMGEDRNLPEP